MPTENKNQIEELRNAIRQRKAELLDLLERRNTTPFNLEDYRARYAAALAAAGREQMLQQAMKLANPHNKDK